VDHRSRQRGIGPIAALLALLALVCPASSAWADEDEEEQKQDFIVSKWAYIRLNEAHELIAKRQYAEAFKRMEQMKGRRGLNDHERTLMWQTIGYIYASQEKVKPAIEAFVACLKLGAIPKGSKLEIQYNLGQLYMIDEQYRKAVDTWTAWMGQVEKVSPQAKYNMAMALVKVKDYNRALGFAKQLTSSARPRENYLQLQMSIHFSLKQKRELVRILKRLIRLYPKRTYWMQLFAAYMELNEETKALAVAQMCYDQGFLKSSSELNNLVSLLVSNGVPYDAAEVLEKAMAEGKIATNTKSLQLLGDTWLRASELDRAIGPLRRAAAMSDKGEIFIRIAQIHMEREEFSLAAKALTSAIKKGGLTDPGNANLLLGIAHFRSKNTAAAHKAFTKALGFKNTARAAGQWIKILEAKHAS